jgi:ssDNA-binding Zn-finger/Zn-ribbon topoisomerase 1
MNGLQPKNTMMLSTAGRYCPRCTKVLHFQYDSTYGGCSHNPILLVKRINKNTKDWFWGCPNFPKCKYTESRPKTRFERGIQIRSWANAQCGPHY